MGKTTKMTEELAAATAKLTPAQVKLVSEIASGLSDKSLATADAKRVLRKRQGGGGATRAPNAYAQFVKANWSRITASNPDAKFSEVSKQLSAEWKARNQ